MELEFGLCARGSFRCSCGHEQDSSCSFRRRLDLLLILTEADRGENTAECQDKGTKVPMTMLLKAIVSPKDEGLMEEQLGIVRTIVIVM